MGIHTSAGTKLYIAAPGTDIPGDQTALTDAFTEVGSITDLGEFGPEFEEITFNELGSRNVRKFKGSRNDGSLELDIGWDVSDEGQKKVREALGSDDDYVFAVLLNDDDDEAERSVIGFEGKVMSSTIGVGDPDSITSGSVQIAIQSGTMQYNGEDFAEATA